MIGRWRRRGYVTRSEFREALESINERISNMATQDDVNALTAELQQVETDLGNISTNLSTSTQTLQAEIDKLAAGNPALDLTALKAEADKLDPIAQQLATSAQTIGGLTPTPPPGG